jgi:hypothetical protein
VELVSVRRDVAFVMTEYRYSERQACKLLDLDRASYRYAVKPDPTSICGSNSLH